jgi:hypothetical protein
MALARQSESYLARCDRFWPAETSRTRNRSARRLLATEAGATRPWRHPAQGGTSARARTGQAERKQDENASGSPERLRLVRWPERCRKLGPLSFTRCGGPPNTPGRRSCSGAAGSAARSSLATAALPQLASGGTDHQAEDSPSFCKQKRFKFALRCQHAGETESVAVHEGAADSEGGPTLQQAPSLLVLRQRRPTKRPADRAPSGA